MMAMTKTGWLERVKLMMTVQRDVCAHASDVCAHGSYGGIAAMAAVPMEMAAMVAHPQSIMHEAMAATAAMVG